MRRICVLNWRPKSFIFHGNTKDSLFLHLYAPAAVPLKFIRGMKELPSATALLLVLFSPLHLDSAFNTLPL